MNMNTVERACGRWRQILPLFGIETRYLRNEHGPCPLCGGKDRFRFDDRDGSGSYYCNQCGAGTGLLMIRKLKGWDHKTACGAVDEIIGGDRDHADTKISSRRDSPETRRRAIMRLLDQAHHPDVVTAYLRRRGLAVTSDVLKGNRYCPYYDENGKLVGYFPAVIAPIIGPDGSLQSVQRIYTTAGLDPRKKITPPVNTICGGAVQLREPEDELGVAEGVETALAAYQFFGVPVWAALCENGLKMFVAPAGVGAIHIFADNDANFVGQEAAYTLARRLSREGLAAEVHIPENIDSDWLDVLTSQS
jgi:putative DNA primase/helicase